MNKQWQISETVQLACLDGLMFGRDEAAAEIELSSNKPKSDIKSAKRADEHIMAFYAHHIHNGGLHNAIAIIVGNKL